VTFASPATQSGAGAAIPFIIVTLIWGSTWLVIRDQLGVVPSSWSVTYRFIIATTVIFAYAAWSRTPLRIPASAAPIVILVGIGQFALNFNFVYLAERHITSGLCAVIFALLIVPNAIFGRLFLQQALSRRFMLGSAVAMAGIALLMTHELRLDGAGNADVVRGVGFTLLAVLCASLANVLQNVGAAKALPVAALVSWGMVAGTLANAAQAALAAGPPVFDPRPGYLAGLFYLAIIASAVAFVLYYRVIREIGAARAAYSSVLIPIIAMALSTLFEGYRWSLLAGCGAALAVAGLVMALSARRPSR
jgi:drug/metabolite transporter (DMT)-like permease